MAAHNRLASAVVLAVLALTGCENTYQPGVDRLQAENVRLQADNLRMQNQLATQQIIMSYNETQASIAAGCDWLIPLCPTRVTTAGHDAQADGYSGASSLWFWFAFLAKLAGTGVFAGALVGVVWWSWIRLCRPEADAVDAAKRLVAEATQDAQAARQQAADAADEVAAMKQLGVDAERQFADLRKQIEARRQDLDVANRDLEGVKSARAALSAFK